MIGQLNIVKVSDFENNLQIQYITNKIPVAFFTERKNNSEHHMESQRTIA